MVLVDWPKIGFLGTRRWHERSERFKRTAVAYEIMWSACAQYC